MIRHDGGLFVTLTPAALFMSTIACRPPPAVQVYVGGLLLALRGKKGSWCSTQMNADLHANSDSERIQRGREERPWTMKAAVALATLLAVQTHLSQSVGFFFSALFWHILVGPTFIFLTIFNRH